MKGKTSGRNLSAPIIAAPNIAAPHGSHRARPAFTTLLAALALAVLLLAPSGLAGCQAAPSGSTTTASELKKYSYEFTGTFDTVIQMIGYARDEATFAVWTKAAEKRFRELDHLFDAYHTFPGLNNLKTINDQAGRSPVQVAPELLELIRLGISWNQTICAKTNIALGPVVLLWQNYRERALADPPQAAIPTEAELAAALAHCDITKIKIDDSAGTVFLEDGQGRLDLGAVAKGYAARLVTGELRGLGATSIVLNAGSSSISLIGQPADGRTAWSVGLQNPFVLLPDAAGNQPGATTTGGTTAILPLPTVSVSGELAAILRASDCSVATSGDYQRFFKVGGHTYHHLIDPADGMPARYFRAVTVVAEDSALADFLSTALFLLPYEQSRALAESQPGINVLWIFPGGRLEMTSGLQNQIEVNP
jgi:FAD:protein FMN transferase